MTARSRAFAAVRDVCGAETCSPSTPKAEVTATNHRLRQALVGLVLVHLGEPCTCDHGPAEHHPRCHVARILALAGGD